MGPAPAPVPHLQHPQLHTQQTPILQHPPPSCTTHPPGWPLCRSSPPAPARQRPAPPARGEAPQPRPAPAARCRGSSVQAGRAGGQAGQAAGGLRPGMMTAAAAARSAACVCVQPAPPATMPLPAKHPRPAPTLVMLSTRPLSSALCSTGNEKQKPTTGRAPPPALASPSPPLPSAAAPAAPWCSRITSAVQRATKASSAPRSRSKCSSGRRHSLQGRGGHGAGVGWVWGWGWAGDTLKLPKPPATWRHTPPSRPAAPDLRGRHLAAPLAQLHVRHAQVGATQVDCVAVPALLPGWEHVHKGGQHHQAARLRRG